MYERNWNLVILNLPFPKLVVFRGGPGFLKQELKVENQKFGTTLGHRMLHLS